MLGSIQVIAAGLALVLATVSSPRPAYGQTPGLNKLDAALVSSSWLSQGVTLSTIEQTAVWGNLASSQAQPARVLQSASQQP